jgi:hypothetical protein
MTDKQKEWLLFGLALIVSLAIGFGVAAMFWIILWILGPYWP